MESIIIQETINGVERNVELREHQKNNYISEYLTPYSKRRGKISPLAVNPIKLTFGFTVDGIRKVGKIHYIAADAFLPLEDRKEYVHFKDGNVNNRHISNLIRSDSPKFLKQRMTIEEIVNINGIKQIKEVEIRLVNNHYISEYAKPYTIKTDRRILPAHIYKRRNNENVRVGDKKHVSVDILTARAFIPIEKELPFVLYKDGNKNNRHYTNLIWSQESELKSESEGFNVLPGFSKYKFTNKGVGKSYRRGCPKLLRAQKHDNGYYFYHLTDDEGVRRPMRRNRIVAMIYIENPDDRPFVDHINKKRDDDDFKNLQWVSHEENMCNKDWESISKKFNKAVGQFSLKGELIEIFKNSYEAYAYMDQEGYKISSQIIQLCCRENRKIEKLEDNISKCDYIWRYMYQKEKYTLKEGEIAVPMKKDFGDIEFDYSHQITNLGNVINKHGYLLSSVVDVYPKYVLSKNGKSRNMFIHTLIGLFFIEGRTDEKKWINHKDENKMNYHYSNLEWVTLKENSSHSSYKRMKPVNQFDKDTGIFIKRYPSIADAAKCFEDSGAAISSCCLGYETTKTVRGYIWRFADDEDNINNVIIDEKRNLNEIDQFDLEGNFIKRHSSASAAADSIKKKCGTNISNCCAGIYKTAYDFIWKYVHEVKIINNN